MREEEREGGRGVEPNTVVPKGGGDPKFFYTGMLPLAKPFFLSLSLPPLSHMASVGFCSIPQCQQEGGI